jgi:hypothetical protein
LLAHFTLREGSFAAMSGESRPQGGGNVRRPAARPKRNDEGDLGVAASHYGHAANANDGSDLEVLSDGSHHR